MDLGERLLAQLVIGLDPAARVNIVNWTRAEPAVRTIIALLDRTDWRATATGPALARLRGRPDSVAAFHDAVALLRAELADRPDLVAASAEPLAEAERLGHCSYWAGEAAEDRDSVSVVDAATLAAAPSPVRDNDGPAELAIVIPVRAAGDDRLRNCLAAVRAAASQTVPRARTRIVVVEQDSRPRLADHLRHLVDEYVFVVNRGEFNKSWAVNIGVDAAGDVPFLCLLDADSLVQPDFAATVLARSRSGADALLPFGDLVFLDAASTSVAIRARLLGADPLARFDPRRLRGFGLREVRGFSVCLTRNRFLACGGMDERYRGWGDEDNEFHRQLSATGSVRRLPGMLVHLWHARPRMVVRGLERPNRHLVDVPRPAGVPRGQRDKYALEADPALAGIVGTTDGD